MKRCLYCYQSLTANETDFHPSCSRKIFDQPVPPDLPYTEAQIGDLALKGVQKHVTVTGVQAKLSLHLESPEGRGIPKRFTIVGLWGGYILKPPTGHYPQLPEVEDLTMHLARLARISVVPHGLIRLQSGSLAYITKRIDRVKTEKLHMEDMCQLTERLTEDKYHGSHEQVAKAILKYSRYPGLDVINYFEQVLFAFLTGNADMHLKNFSLIKLPGMGHVLSPAYDLVATALVNPADKEDLALTLNGKKKKITREDFIVAFKTLNLDPKQQENIFRKMMNAKAGWMDFIGISFLSDDFKERLMNIIEQRFCRIK
ncbi:MAG: HipA domain-containing protein [Bacteroidales bacterium]